MTDPIAAQALETYERFVAIRDEIVGIHHGRIALRLKAYKTRDARCHRSFSHLSCLREMSTQWPLAANGFIRFDGCHD